MIIQYDSEIFIITYLVCNSITCDGKSFLGIYRQICMRRELLGNLFRFNYALGIYLETQYAIHNIYLTFIRKLFSPSPRVAVECIFQLCCPTYGYAYHSQ